MASLLQPSSPQITRPLKPSGIQWLGDVPSDWEVKRAKYYLHEIDFRSKTGNEELLSVSHLTGVTPRSEKNITMFQAESYEGSKLCWPGDLVINTMWAWMAALGVSRRHGIVSPSYAVYRLIRSEDFDPRYFDFLLRIPAYAAEFRCRSTGIRGSRMRLYPDEFLKIPVLRPPLATQQLILAFLDRKLEQIDRYLAIKRRQIELVEEYRDVLINHAVTCGLISGRNLQQTGNKLLPILPLDWKLLPLRRRWSVIDCKHRTVEFLDVGYPVVSIQQVSGQTVDLSTAKRTGFRDFLDLCEGERKPRRGDLIFSRNASLGNAAFVDTDEDFCLGQDVCLIRAADQDQQFLAYQLRSSFVKRQLESLMIGSTFNRINIAQIMSFLIACPSLSEQQEIAAHCLRVSAEVAPLLQATQREIDLMTEYRTALIAEAVTGRLDVRRAD